MSTVRYSVNWKETKTGKENHGTNLYPEAQARIIIDVLNRRYAGRVEYWIEPEKIEIDQAAQLAAGKGNGE